jgi:hypothetical protein
MEAVMNLVGVLAAAIVLLAFAMMIWAGQHQS